MKPFLAASFVLIGLLLTVTPVDAQTYFPFGSVVVGVSSTNVRVGPFGCYVNTSDPTYTNAQIHPCSLTTTGRIRVDTTMPAPSASAADAIPDCVIVSAASNNATNCATAVANFFGYELYNTTTTVYYLRLYNLASAPTCSSATGFIRSIPIPPASAAGQVGSVIAQYIIPKNYTTGLGFCITAESSSTGNTSAAVGIFGALKYKQ